MLFAKKEKATKGCFFMFYSFFIGKKLVKKIIVF